MAIFPEIFPNFEPAILNVARAPPLCPMTLAVWSNIARAWPVFCALMFANATSERNIDNKIIRFILSSYIFKLLSL